MPFAKLKPSTYILLAAIALTLAVLNPASRDALTQITQLYFASESQASASRSQGDAGGQTASPNPGDSGFDQEERVRQLLAKQHNQSYTTEKAINDFLGFKGKTADFLGYNSKTKQWLIAESKGSNLDHAYSQLENTLLKLLDKYPKANAELRMYLNERNFKLLNGNNEIAGWSIDEAGYLGAFNEQKQWEYTLIRGIKILVLSAP